jgi:type II secretory pathway component PulC
MNTGSIFTIFLLLAVMNMAACGARHHDVEVVTETEPRPAAPPPAPAMPEHQSEKRESLPDETISQIPKGAILRSDLNRVIAAGPAALLARVSTEPERQGKRFIGFRIAAFHPEAPSALELQVGDVIIAVNGLAIMTPQDFFRVFQELKVASELRFDIIRDNSRKSLVYPIVE